MNNAMWIVTFFGLLVLGIFIFPPPDDEEDPDGPWSDEDKS